MNDLPLILSVGRPSVVPGPVSVRQGATMIVGVRHEHYPAIMVFCRNSPDWRVPLRKEEPCGKRGTVEQERADRAFAFRLDRRVRDAAAGKGKYDDLEYPAYPGPKRYDHLIKPDYS